MSKGTMESHMRILNRLSAMLARTEKPKRVSSRYMHEKLARTMPSIYVEKVLREKGGE